MSGSDGATRLLIADEPEISRTGTRALLESHLPVSVVGEAADGLRLLELARELEPDVILMELALPRVPGIEVIRRISRNGSPSRIAVLSSWSDRDDVIAAMRAGACAYVSRRRSSLASLFDAIAAARAGERFLAPDLRAVAGDALRSAGGGDDRAPAPLTRREREVLAHIVSGLSSREIGARLRVATRTIESHRAKIMKKLCIHKASGLVRFAIREGLGP